MEYVTTTYGERRRVHREYVDVYCRMGRDGQILPVRVLWRDGRSYPVDEVVEAGGFGAMVRGRQTARYRVRLGRHETDLYLERRAARPRGRRARDPALVGQRLRPGQAGESRRMPGADRRAGERNGPDPARCRVGAIP